MYIDIVLPVVNYRLGYHLLKSIEANTLLPREVLVIDNNLSGKPFVFKTNKFSVVRLKSMTGRLNESWEVARSRLRKDSDYVSFLNDDIIVGDWFLQRVYETFRANSKCGVACPLSHPFIHEVVKGKVRYSVMKKRDACALTIRKDLLDKIPPVPYNRITTFHGDDWLWFYTKKLGYEWMVDEGNAICHFVGISVRRKGFREIKKKEKNEWDRIFREEFCK